MAAKPVPDGFHTVTPYMLVADAAAFVEFAKAAFGAQETERITEPGGGIMHAEVRIGTSMLMIGQTQGKWKAMPCSLYLYVEDADALYRRALSAGATSLMEPADQFYGDRMSGVQDPAGNMWWIATRKEDVAPEEMQRRAEAAVKQRQAAS